jgi:acetoin utilization protein AcuB
VKHQPTIKVAMTPFPYSVDIGAPVPQAQEFMRTHKIRHLPVTDNGRLIGVVTDRDIKLLLGPDFDYPAPADVKVSDAMVEEAYLVEDDTPLVSVLEHMAEHRIGSAIVTRKGKLVGVFTSIDAFRVFAEFLRNELPGAAGDDAA